jgi:hypothetical protein
MKPVCEGRVTASHNVTTLSCVCQSRKYNDVSFLPVLNFYFRWIYVFSPYNNHKIFLKIVKDLPRGISLNSTSPSTWDQACFVIRGSGVQIAPVRPDILTNNLVIFLAPSNQMPKNTSNQATTASFHSHSNLPLMLFCVVRHVFR